MRYSIGPSNILKRFSSMSALIYSPVVSTPAISLPLCASFASDIRTAYVDIVDGVASMIFIFPHFFLSSTHTCHVMLLSHSYFINTIISNSYFFCSLVIWSTCTSPRTSHVCSYNSSFVNELLNWSLYPLIPDFSDSFLALSGSKILISPNF